MYPCAGECASCEETRAYGSSSLRPVFQTPTSLPLSPLLSFSPTAPADYVSPERNHSAVRSLDFNSSSSSWSDTADQPSFSSSVVGPSRSNKRSREDFDQEVALLRRDWETEHSEETSKLRRALERVTEERDSLTLAGSNLMRQNASLRAELDRLQQRTIDNAHDYLKSVVDGLINIDKMTKKLNGRVKRAVTEYV